MLAVAIAAPLFQAARDEGAPRTPYAAVHDYAWQNVVLWFACWLFVLIVWIMAWLLASLFQLIKIELLHELLMKNWFVRALIGLAFGAALGLLREHDTVVRLLQRVVATVLAVLAPVLAIGLGLFLLALPFTGLQALWDATSATTPLLLSCAVGALILANAVIGNRLEEERRNLLLRYGAMLLAVVILPLAVLAAIATGLRVGQYGYTPERLWAIVFVGIAILYGAAYLGSLVLGRLAWTTRVRPANLALAFLLCSLGLLLATPLVNFNRISTDDQVGRLESGRIAAGKFDWAALAFDFGKPGRDAVERLRRSRNAAIRGKAEEAAKAESRWDLAGAAKTPQRSGPKSGVLDNARVLPEGASAPKGLIDLLAGKISMPPGQSVHDIPRKPGGGGGVRGQLLCGNAGQGRQGPQNRHLLRRRRSFRAGGRRMDGCRRSLRAERGAACADRGRLSGGEGGDSPRRAAAGLRRGRARGRALRISGA